MRITCCTCSQSLSTLSAFGNDNHVYKCVTAEQWDGLCIQYGMVYVSFDRVKISYELCLLVLMWQIPSKLSTRQGYEEQSRRFRFFFFLSSDPLQTENWCLSENAKHKARTAATLLLHPNLTMYDIFISLTYWRLFRAIIALSPAHIATINSHIVFHVMAKRWKCFNK